MKRLLIILGATFLTLIIVIAAAIGFFAIEGSGLDKQSKAYVDRNIPLIFTTWDAQALWSHASPEFMQTTTQNKLVTAFAGLSHKLGKMRGYEGSDGQAYINDGVLSHHNGEVITAVYTARVTFDAGPADIKVKLIKHGKRWQFEDVHISSDVLLER